MLSHLLLRHAAQCVTAAGGRCVLVQPPRRPATMLRGWAAASLLGLSSGRKSWPWWLSKTGSRPTPPRSTRVRACARRTPRCAPHACCAAFVLRLDAFAAEECDRAAAAVASDGRDSLAAQVRRACELVQDGLVERDTEVRYLSITWW